MPFKLSNNLRLRILWNQENISKTSDLGGDRA